MVLWVVVIGAATGGFVLGYVVGKNFFPSPPQSMTGPLPNETQSAAAIPGPTAAPGVGTAPALLPDRNSPAGKTAQGASSVPFELPPVKRETGGEGTAGSSKVPGGKDKTLTGAAATENDGAALGQSPAQGKVEQASSEPAGASRRENGYSVQAGAFRNRKDAEKLKHKLEVKGYKVSVKKEANTKGVVLYKVRTGEFRQKKEASVFALRLKKAYGLNAFATPRD
ncbi:MAG: SPOR domain-containing protein [Nitrospirae bacterium]|nr:SPOR domain-containing protein [Nitrospirota bacterium]